MGAILVVEKSINNMFQARKSAETVCNSQQPVQLEILSSLIKTFFFGCSNRIEIYSFSIGKQPRKKHILFVVITIR